MLRVGVLSDLHCDLQLREPRRWINEWQPKELKHRVQEALQIFAQAPVDLIAVLGDLCTGDPDSFRKAIGWITAKDRPMVVVRGNHDPADAFQEFGTGDGDTFAPQLLASSGIDLQCLDAIPDTVETGVFRTEALDLSQQACLRLVLSHFPILSERRRLQSARMPYSGDLQNRSGLAQPLLLQRVPAVILNGHVHARCSQQYRSVLQLTAGALIESPFECAIVDLETEPEIAVRRKCYRLGPAAETDPVFAADVSRWAWHASAWVATTVATP